MGTRSGAMGLASGVGRWRALALPLLAAVAGLLLTAAPAQSAFHFMKVREVYPGTSNDSYVVLQMLFTNENALGGHSLRLYNASGGTIETFTFSPGYVAFNATHGNNTVLIGDTGVQTTFGVAPDDQADANLNVPASGGAVCWLDGSPVDCVSWGNFSGSLPNSAGTPASASGVTVGKALRRRIDLSGCPTYLEGSDDTNVSASDFSEQNPNPRNNGSVPTETQCPSLPNTTIGTKPANPTKNTSASFTFSANPVAGATFQCKLDAEPSFSSCTSPQEYTDLDEGNHSFEVRAVNSAGPDPTPATHQWRVDLTAPVAEIKTQPPDPSPGNSVAFTYSSNEGGSTFQCSLVPFGNPDSFSSCPPTGKNYAGVADGEYTFKVRATDPATNQGAPDSFSWEVDNLLNDETPPQTTILSKPANPSGSATAAFSYESNEPGSTFECKLDGGAFVGCDATGVSYFGLINGPHSFQVRARDAIGNIDQSPAGYSWDVAVVTIEPTIPLPPVFPQLPSAVSPAARPQTILTSKPGALTRDRTPTFRFRSSLAGSRFGCKVDRGPFRPCSSPFTAKALSFGTHIVQIRAAVGGLVDLSPAKSSFRVAKAKGKRRP